MFRKKEHPPSKNSEQSTKVNKSSEVSDKFGMSLKITNGEPQIVVSSKIGLVTLGAGVLWLVRKTVLLQVAIIIGGLSILFVICYRKIVITRNECKENDNKIEESKENRKSNQELKEVEVLSELDYEEKQQKYQHEENMRIFDIVEKNPQISPVLIEVLMKRNIGYDTEKKDEENKTEIISFAQNNGKERIK